MTTRSFSIGEMLKLGWRGFKNQPYTWVAALILIALILGTHPLVNNLLTGKGLNWEVNDQNFSAEGRNGIIMAIVSLLYIIIQAGLGLGLTYMGLRAADGLPINLGHLFSRFQYVIHYLIASFLYTLMITVGFILLIFPGAIWASQFSLFTYFIIDKGNGPIEALKNSSHATNGAKWDIFGFLVMSIFLLSLGVIAILLGLIIVLPIITIGWAGIYRYLTRSTTTVSDPQIESGLFNENKV